MLYEVITRSKSGKLSPEDISDIRINKAEIIEFLGKIDSTAHREVFSAITAAADKEYYRLSSAQERMYLLQQMSPGSTAYVITSYSIHYTKLYDDNCNRQTEYQLPV